MLAAGRVVARSDEALEAVAAARARSDPDACIASGEIANVDIVLRLLAPCGGLFWHASERLSLTTSNVPAPSRTRRRTRLNCLWVRSSHLAWNPALSRPLCGWARASPDRPAVRRLAAELGVTPDLQTEALLAASPIGSGPARRLSNLWRRAARHRTRAGLRAASNPGTIKAALEVPRRWGRAAGLRPPAPQ
jgi:hypothetical protein